MIGYVTVGTNDLPRAAKFYDALFEGIAHRFMEMESFIAWSSAPDKAGFAAIKPFNGMPATPGNGTMVAFAVDTTEKVDALYRRAISLGATDEGAPGPRGDDGFYAAYFRDLDQNKINFFCIKK